MKSPIKPLDMSNPSHRIIYFGRSFGKTAMMGELLKAYLAANPGAQVVTPKPEPKRLT